MTNARFNPEMLVLSRESREMTQADLARAAKVRQGTISKVEAGILSPTKTLLNDFAEILDYPVEFFFQEERVYGFNSTVFFHRKRQSLSERTLRRLHAHMNIMRIRISRLRQSVELPKCRFQAIEPEDYQDRADVVARLVKSTWLVPFGPVRNVTQAIEEAGGIVIPFDFGTRQADAISEWVPGYPPIFLVNSNADITGDRLRLTLAHEIGHIVMHRLPNPKMEDEANLFAAEFLMPRKEIKSSLYSLSIPKLIELKAEWSVSMAALVQRACELKTITDGQRRYLFIQLGQAGWRTREPAYTDISIEQPQLFDRLIQEHLGGLGYSVGQLSTLMFIKEEDKFRAEYLSPKGLRLVG